MVEQVKAPKKAPVSAQIDLASPSLYINRELSLLEFEQRVIAQATDHRHPLIERVRFMAMFGEQMDEFFMVRVSDVQDELEHGQVSLTPEALTPAQQLSAIRKR